MITELDLLRMGYKEVSPGAWQKMQDPIGIVLENPASHRVQSAPVSPPYERMLPHREPKPKRMTQCEERWYRVLQDRASYEMACEPRIIPQFRLRASAWDAVCPTHYTADFAYWSLYRKDLFAWDCVLWEVKDKRRKPHSDELVRSKMVREHNPFVSSVWLAEWDGEKWNERRLA